MKTFTMKIDDKCDQVLEDLKRKFGRTSKAEVFRLAIAMLKIVAEGRDDGFRMVLVKNGSLEKEIVIPT